MANVPVKIEYSYGQERIYPQLYQKEIEHITKKKTLSRRDISIFKKLGVSFTLVNELNPV